MRELSEQDIQRIVGGIPSSDLVLFCPGLQGKGGTLIDRSQYANNGAIKNATWVRTSRGIRVLSFNGTNANVLIPNHASINISGDLTILFWLKTSVDVPVGQSAYIVEKWAGSGGFPYGTRLTEDEKLIFYDYDATNANSLTSDSAVNDGVWHLCGLTRDTTANKLYWYIDGSLDKEGAWTQYGTITNSSRLAIGCRVDEHAQTFLTGYVGIPRIDDQVLSPTQHSRVFTRERLLFGV